MSSGRCRLVGVVCDQWTWIFFALLFLLVILQFIHKNIVFVAVIIVIIVVVVVVNIVALVFRSLTLHCNWVIQEVRLSLFLLFVVVLRHSNSYIMAVI